MEKSRWRSPDPAPTPECFAFAPTPEPGGGRSRCLCVEVGECFQARRGEDPVFEEGDKVGEARRGDKCGMQNAECRMKI